MQREMQTFVFVVRIDGRTRYTEDLTDYPDDTEAAAVLVLLQKNGKEICRDEMIEKQHWGTIADGKDVLIRKRLNQQQ